MEKKSLTNLCLVRPSLKLFCLTKWIILASLTLILSFSICWILFVLVLVNTKKTTSLLYCSKYYWLTSVYSFMTTWNVIFYWPILYGDKYGPTKLTHLQLSMILIIYLEFFICSRNIFAFVELSNDKGILTVSEPNKK